MGGAKNLEEIAIYVDEATDRNLFHMYLQMCCL